jgi:flagellar biosynthesis protein FlhF
MQIKTYTAASMKDALAQIKTELGSDAVIISTRQITDNKHYGMMSRPMIEVVAAVDYDGGAFAKNAKGAKVYADASAELAVPVSKGSASMPEHLSDELIEIKKMLKSFMARSGINAEAENPVREKLLAGGIRPELADLIISKLGRDAGEDDVKTLLGKLIRTESPTNERVWAFFGTTGVGKTTTIAKIAARSALNENKRVALLTLDAYRIGAIDQSRIYAKILNIPFISVTTPEELKTALNQFSNMDLILVDTVGRSPFCNDYIFQLLKYFEDVPACRFLLIPVATRDKEMETATKTYSRLGIDRIIFTKADEAHCSGSMVTHNLIHRTPISYITTGQRVPEDIEQATASMIIASTFGDAR